MDVILLQGYVLYCAPFSAPFVTYLEKFPEVVKENVEHLTIREISIGENLLAEIRRCHKLKTLHLTISNTTDKQALNEEFLKFVGGQLRHFECNLGRDDFANLDDLVHVYESKTLFTLNVCSTRNAAAPMWLPPSFGRIFHIQSICNLVLDLYTDEMAMIAPALLTKVPSLTFLTLKLYCNGEVGESTKRIFMYLRRAMCRLTDFALQFDELMEETEGVSSFLSVLPGNRSLNSLRLHNLPLWTPACIPHLANLIKNKHHNLHSIDLAGPRFQTPTAVYDQFISIPPSQSSQQLCMFHLYHDKLKEPPGELVAWMQRIFSNTLSFLNWAETTFLVACYRANKNNAFLRDSTFQVSDTIPKWLLPISNILTISCFGFKQDVGVRRRNNRPLLNTKWFQQQTTN